MLASKPNVPSILPHPPAPATLEEAGLSLDLIVQLALKTLHFVWRADRRRAGRRLGLRFSVIEPALTMIKTQHQVEIVGGAMIGGPSYRYRITDAGRVRAQLFLETNHYVGAAPVPLAQYRALHGRVQEEGAAHGDARARAPGVLAPGDQRPRDGPARPGDQRRATRCSSTARPATARPSSRRPSRSCSTATSTSRTRSRSRARSSGCSTRSTTKSCTDEQARSRASTRASTSTAAGCAAGVRW